MDRPPAFESRGFTLIEMIAVLTVSAILAVVVWRNISAPIAGFEDATRRAGLVDIAETALNRMTREVRLAVPNTVRINGGAATSCVAGGGSSCTLELLRTADGGRYRAQADTTDDVCAGAGGSDDVLDFTATADCFEVLGGLSAQAVVDCGGGGCNLVIYNAGPPGGPDAYAGDNVAAIDSLTTNSIDFSAAPPFPFRSPNQRFQIVDTPVSFVCDSAADELRRHDGYAIGGAPGGAGQLLANRIERCRFAYDPGTASRGGLVTVEITVTGQGVLSGADEQVMLLQQVHIPNVP